MGRIYPNLPQGYIGSLIETVSTPETRLLRNGASLGIYIDKGEGLFNDTSWASGTTLTVGVTDPNYTSEHYKGRYSNVTVTGKAGTYLQIWSGHDYQYGRSTSYAYYAVTDYEIRMNSEHDQDAVYQYYVYLVSGTLERITLKANSAPTPPTTINVPGGTIYSSTPVDISWSESTDPDGDSVGYELERQLDGSGSFTRIYRGSARSYQDTIPAGTHTSVIYRVRAYDSEGNYSSYCTGPVRFVINNTAPTTPGSITVPDTIRGGTDVAISWAAATDADDNLDGYIVERSYNGGTSWSQIYQGRATSTTSTVPFGTTTVMFRVQAYDTAGAKSGWRTSANRTVVNNRAPSAPPSISVPLTPAGGESLTVTWTAATDADGNREGYELERQWDGAGEFERIYQGAALSYQDSIPKGAHSSVVYRVRAYDSFDAYSAYTTSPSRTIDNNTAPVIACDLSGDLGEKSEGFSIPYTVSDAEQQAVTVTEKVGDLVKRTYKATLDEQATFEVTGEYFQRILNGAQAVQIVATDSAGKSSTFELPFTKAVHKAVITLDEPLAVEEQITVAVLAITGKIPADATQLIELTSNGNDPEPVWEDATADVKAGRNHPFTNKTQTNGWAFNFRVTVERGESGEDGYIVSIQGGFQ